MNLFPSNIINSHVIATFIDTYAKRDNWHCIDKKTNNLGYGFLHYALIRLYQPKRILVIGSKYGFIPALCAMACKDNKCGHVDFVDAGYNKRVELSDKHWDGVGYWKTKKGKDIFEKFNLEKYITLYVMTSSSFRKHHKKMHWGYIYIDGDHSFQGVQHDFIDFYPRLLQFGFLALHDISTKGENGELYGVGKFWQRIKRWGTSSCVEFPGVYGLGLMQKTPQNKHIIHLQMTLIRFSQMLKLMKIWQ